MLLLIFMLCGSSCNTTTIKVVSLELEEKSVTTYAGHRLHFKIDALENVYTCVAQVSNTLVSISVEMYYDSNFFNGIITEQFLKELKELPAGSTSYTKGCITTIKITYIENEVTKTIKAHGLLFDHSLYVDEDPNVIKEWKSAPDKDKVRLITLPDHIRNKPFKILKKHLAAPIKSVDTYKMIMEQFP